MFLQAEVLLGPFDSFHFNFILDTNPVPISRTSFRLAEGVYLELCTRNCEEGLGDFSVDFFTPAYRVICIGDIFRGTILRHAM